MKLLLRLQRLRSMQEMNAEAHLQAARSGNAAALAALAWSRSQAEQLREQATTAVIEGDTDAMHLLHLDIAEVLAASPRLRDRVDQTDAVKHAMEEAYFVARREHLMLNAMLKLERMKMRRNEERREQKELDQAYATRRKQTEILLSMGRRRALLRNTVQPQRLSSRAAGLQ